jgi:hypothetical protein
MVIKIKKKSSRKKVHEALKKLPKRSAKIDLKKYFGKVNFEIDGLSYQKSVRQDD